jgi:hypothetical protein
VFGTIAPQVRNIDQPGRAFDIVFDQVDQVGAARNELRGRVCGDLLDGVGDVAGARVLERGHDRSIAC